jgi:DNA-binding response OmpR family regulator
MLPHILVVDASRTVRMDLRSALTSAGFNVTVCETKALALRALKEKAFSLLFLDVLLPDGDGIDFVRELRSMPDFASLPIILLSGETDVKHRALGLSMGANEYIGKPYDRSYLVLRASRLINPQKAQLPACGAGGTTVLDKRILVVDDSATYRETLSQMVRRDGCEAILASSGEEALALLAIEQVDCVIMDLMMPGIGGMETAQRIKRIPTLAHIPIIIMTGLDDPQIRAQGLAIGVDRFLLKSPELPLLMARLRSLFRKQASSCARPPSPAAREGRLFAPAPAAHAGADAGSSGQGTSSLAIQGALFERVIAASGLSRLIGSNTLSRACRRAGVEPRTMSPADLSRALPAIEEALRTFLDEEEYRRGVAAIAALAQPPLEASSAHSPL